MKPTTTSADNGGLATQFHEKCGLGPFTDRCKRSAGTARQGSLRNVFGLSLRTSQHALEEPGEIR